MSARGGFPIQKYSCWQLRNLSLTGKAHTPGDFKTIPSLAVSVSAGGNPKIKVYENITEGDTRSINVNLKPEDLFTILEGIKTVAESSEPSKYVLKVSDIFRNGQRLETPAPAAAIYWGRNAEDIVYIGVQRHQGVLNLFEFKLGYLTKLVGDDGEPVKPGYESSLKAKAWVNLMQNLVSGFIAGIDEDSKLAAPAANNKPAYAPRPQQPYAQSAPAQSGGFNDAFEDDVPF